MPQRFHRFTRQSGKWYGETPSQGQSAIRSDDIIFGVAHMKIDANTVQRLPFCAHEACREAFTICVSCDRGQRYCSPECRLEVRRRQRHEANRRYQQSEPGRASPRRCQKRYRERASGPVCQCDTASGSIHLRPSLGDTGRHTGQKNTFFDDR